MIEYRLATESDIPSLEKLIPLSVRGLQGPFYSPAQMESALEAIFTVDSQLIRDRTYFVAVHDDRIVGCGGWSRRKSFAGGDKTKSGGPEPLLNPKVDPARVRAFFIHPEYARRGISSEIVRLSESALVAAGFSEAFIVATLPGEKLYERFGYSVVRQTEMILPDGKPLPVVEMAKKFSPQRT